MDNKEDNLTYFTGRTTLDINPKQILDYAANKVDFEEVIILGYTKGEGDEPGLMYFASSKSDKKSALFLLEEAKFNIMS